MIELIFNLLQTSALLGGFFLVYYVLIRKDTYYQFKRFYLFLGVIISAILPWIYFTKTVIVESRKTEPSGFITNNYLQEVVQINDTAVEASIDWIQALFYIYLTISLVVLCWYVYRYLKLFIQLRNSPFTEFGSYKLHITLKKIEPFSFFNHIVMSQSDYDSTQRNFILAHEITHIKQWHSLDMVFMNLTCSFFWFNPIIWMYRSHWIQNLEHIADEVAVRNTDKSEYQYLLLNRILKSKNFQPIKNTLFQPSIKQRIMMLNKPKTAKYLSLKSLLVIPVLVLFVMNFQIKINAQERQAADVKVVMNSIEYTESSAPSFTTSKRDPFDINNYNKAKSFVKSNNFVQSVSGKNDKIVVLISKNSDKKYLDGTRKTMKEKYDFDLEFKNIEFNEKGELIAIEVIVDCNDGFGGSKTIKSDEPITDIYFYRDYTINTSSAFGIGGESILTEDLFQTHMNGSSSFHFPSADRFDYLKKSIKFRPTGKYFFVDKNTKPKNSVLSNPENKDDENGKMIVLKSETTSQNVKLDGIKKYMINSRTYELSDLYGRILLVENYDIPDDQTIKIEGEFKDDLFESKLGIGDEREYGDLNIIFFGTNGEPIFSEMKNVSIQKIRSVESIKADDSIDLDKLEGVAERYAVDFEMVETFTINNGSSYGKNVLKNHNILVEDYSFDSEDTLKINGELIHKDRFFLKLTSFGIINSNGQLLRPISYIAFDENNKPALFKLKDIRKL